MNVTSSGSKPRAVVLNVRDRTRGWLNAVNLHWAGVGLLAVLNLYLLLQMGLAWRLANSQDADAMAQQRIQLKAAEISSKPLQGLDVKLSAASGKANQFYLDRLPVSYSEIATELGVLKNRTHVRLTRINYTQPVKGGVGANAATPSALSVPSSDRDHLTEVLMDASLTGDYRALVLFLNGLERDRVFFLINGVTLTGQQTGQVSLRIRLTTFLRGLAPGDNLVKANVDASTLTDAETAAEAQERRTQQTAAGGAR